MDQRYSVSKCDDDLCTNIQLKHVVLVDPISTGAVLAQRLQQKGVKMIRVWSELTPEEFRKFVAVEEIQYEATIQHVAGCLSDTVAAIQQLGLEPVAVIVGCESGVLLGDQLAEALNLRGNGTKLSSCRRNKFLQQERVRESGLDACKQRLALTMSDVEEFLSGCKKLEPFKAVVKPTEGAGTDGVTLCDSHEEVRTAFKSIAGKVGVFGETNEGALLQEFLKGDEYVVDTVSLEGEHKCVAIWRYDKRRYNDAPFVYFGMELLPIDSMPHLWPMVHYIWNVLDALGIRNGAMHSEVMQTARGPVLVEVNCRCHGGEGTWAPMVEACLGYSQVTALIDSCFDAEVFKSLPQVPSNFRCFAREAKLRSDVEGTLASIDEEKLAKIRKLPSYKCEFMNPSITVGKHIAKTVDAVSASGNMNMVNESVGDLLHDYDELHRIVAEGIFTVKEKNPSVNTPVKHVVLVDPISTGAVLAQRLQQKGVKMIRVWSELTPEELRKFVAVEEIQYEATVQHTAGRLADTVAAIQQLGLKPVAVIVGCECGVLLGDQLAEALKLRGNGTKLSSCRRNKFLQQERVRESGLDACKQRLALTMSDVEDFLSGCKNVEPFKAVVKPTEGAGTDGVTLCDSHEEVRTAFKSIAGKVGIFGEANEGALLQEFLKGDEYVVDTVSLEGEHKCVAVWRYDKRRYNDAPFVYFGLELLPIDSMPHLWPMVRYVWSVLDALGLRNGAMHSEVMQTARGPVLVEVNCRCHGGEGTWAPMAEACLGYSQVTALIDSCLDAEAFKALPQVPSHFRCYAREANLRSDVEGTLASIDEEKLAKIRKLPSYRCEFINPSIAVGMHITKTIDLLSCCGNINMVSESFDDLLHDYDECHRIVAEGLFTVEEKNPRVNTPVKHVVLVDPISTGAVLAQRLQQKGVKMIRVWSELTPEEFRKFVAVEEIQYEATIQHAAGRLADTVAAIQQLGLEPLAVIVGCETGVVLGDQLAEGLKLRGNGTKLSSCRRNKFLQQERVRESGLDACKQRLALTMSDVEEFLSGCKNVEPFKAVVKPTEGAGTDGVTLCDSHEEVRRAFKSIAGKVGIFGETNEGALLQEFLKGDEYVVDTVSLEGEHKCVAIWRYDKRRYNDAPFVYFGMELLPIDSMPHLWPMVRYVWSVLDALGIRNGAMHSEVMQTARGPVLVEVNCRCHGGEGTWAPMVEACLGYSQVTALIDSCLDAEAFKSLPQVPSHFRCYAREAKLRSDVEGILASIDEEKLSKIRQLPSYRCEFINPSIAVGKRIVKTIDAVSASGNINMVNETVSDVLRDYDELHRIVTKGLFTVEKRNTIEEKSATDSELCIRVQMFS